MWTTHLRQVMGRALVIALLISGTRLALAQSAPAAKPAETKPLVDRNPEEAAREREATLNSVRVQREKPLSYQVGDPAPALDVVRWADGKQHSLKEFEGKVVVLEFTASWCAPCRENAAVMKKVAAKYKDDVVFVGISASGATDEELKPWLEQDKWPPQLAVDAADPDNKLGKTAKAYGVFVVPTTVVIDRFGRVSHSDEILARHPLSEEELRKLMGVASKFLGRTWPPEDPASIKPEEFKEISEKLAELRNSLYIDAALARKK